MHISYSGEDTLEEEKLTDLSDEYKTFGNTIIILEKYKGDFYTSVWRENEDSMYSREYAEDGGEEVKEWFQNISSEANAINTRPL